MLGPHNLLTKQVFRDRVIPELCHGSKLCSLLKYIQVPQSMQNLVLVKLLASPKIIQSNGEQSPNLVLRK